MRWPCIGNTRLEMWFAHTPFPHTPFDQGFVPVVGLDSVPRGDGEHRAQSLVRHL